MEKKGTVEEIQFSGPTYQIKVLDPQESQAVWCFLQLHENGDIKDAICSCHQAEGGCPHLALSYLHIFNPQKVPLHERFAQSLWNALGKLWFHKFPDKYPARKCIDPLGKSEEKTLHNIFSKKKETEENSIKFSNLSEEELEASRLGHFSESLAYELSPWSDLAKYFFVLSEKTHPEVLFVEDNQNLPELLKIRLGNFLINTSLAISDWENLIPSLNSLPSHLHVFNQLTDCVSQVFFDEEKKQFLLQIKSKPAKTEGISFFNWIYVPHQGFYAKKPLFPHVVEKEEIFPFLKTYYDEMERVWTQGKWDKVPQKVHYELAFDDAWNLHLHPFLHHPKDLLQKFCWKNFCYIPGKGLYKLLQEPFLHLPSKVAESDIPHFINSYASWLNEQKGFTTHLGDVQSQILYFVDSKQGLTFEKKSASHKPVAKIFGPWVYIPEEGFFKKRQSEIKLPAMQLIRPDQIASFIDDHLQELQAVSNFFLQIDPLEDVGIEVHFSDRERITVDPYYRLKPEFSHIPFTIYGNWIYVHGKGFWQLSAKQILPIHEPLWIRNETQKTFFSEEIHQLKPWIKNIDPHLIKPQVMTLHLQDIGKGPAGSWKMHFYYKTENGILSLLDFILGFKKGKPYLFTSAGRIDLHEERFRWIKKLPKESVDSKGAIFLSTAQVLRLHAYEEIIPDKKCSKLLQQITDLEVGLKADCSQMQGVLRPYQQKGVAWLLSLYVYRLGGLLCDEMGLGKTHQAMALCAAIRKMESKPKFLVVCPTSVLYHWEDKLTQFFPTLKTHTFHGTFRNKAIYKEVDLLLTSYGILRSDKDWFSKMSFDVAIYDEIQVAKNHKSKLYAALQTLSAELKIGLTGTPVENRLRELKALFDLVLPGYMPTDAEYRKQIVHPIEKAHDMQKKELLQRLTFPFVLRRKKQDVMQDLPDKTEEIAHCDLSSFQKALYTEALMQGKQEFLPHLLDDSKPIPFIHIFSLLSQLKQICNHPALYLKKLENYKEFASGKWDLFVELLSEARESGQKVVVYSQYLGMLDIIESYLREQKIGFASLRGSTRDRKGQIALFHSDPQTEVFVASLKAAGLGIDLTAASVVIHYDRWWNPARENQATDRIHRFGQHRGVQVFKFVTKNTFEERIDQIIERKKKLFEEAVPVDDHETLKTLSREEIYQLFNPQA